MVANPRNKPGVDFLLVTALPQERDALLDKLPDCEKLPPTKDDIRTYFQADLPVIFPGNSTGTYEVIVMCLLGMGRVQAVVATTDAIRRWSPRYVLLVGIAGGIAARNVNIGDIIISDQIVDYELQKLTPLGPEIRWDVQRADPRLLDACNNFSDESWYKAGSIKRPIRGKSRRHTGPIASGDKVIAFSEILTGYRHVWPKLIGVEMEAAGVATAAFQSPERPGFFMIRGVSDLADETKNVPEVEEWRSYACDIASSFAISLLKGGPVPLSESRESRSRVEITLNGDFEDFTRNRQEDVVSALAALLRVDRRYIRIIKITPGSIVLILEMPDTAVDHLYILAVDNDSRLSGLGVKSISMKDRKTVNVGVREGKQKDESLNTNRALKVFLCHSSNDKQKVRELYQQLKNDALDVWLDEENLLPGQDWDFKIREAVRETDIVVVCLSNNSITKRGFVQKEIKIALDVADEQPEDTIFLIPVKLEECKAPLRLSRLQWVNLFESNGYSRLYQALQAQAKKLGLRIDSASSIGPSTKLGKHSKHDEGGKIIISPDLAEYKQYPWQPFLSFRFLESLDSTRFSNMTQSPEIRVLNAKSELLESLLFGDAIALSENQVIDSRGAVEALSELTKGANDAGVRIPLRVASRIPNQSVFALMSQRVGNIDEAQLSQRFVISANPALDLDVERRKLWSTYLLQGMKGLDGILRNSSSSEAEFVNNWFTTLDYIDNESGLIIGARHIPERFPREIKQVLDLTYGDLEDMCSQSKDANIPELMHPQWFSGRDEAGAASKIISGLQSIVDEIGGIPNARSPIYTKLAELEKTDPPLVEGIREIVDSVYNHSMGLAVQADSLSDTTGGDTRNILVRAGHALSQWVRQTEKRSEGNYTYELPWAWGGLSQLTWSKSLQIEQINQVIKQVPWQAILEATKESKWKESLANYRTTLNHLQSVDRISISLGAMGKEWRQKHLDAHKVLNEAWQKHIEISARLISNEFWELTHDGFQYHLPESGKRALPAYQRYRTTGTSADSPVEIPVFRTSSIEKLEFEQNIFGAINEIAQKRQH